MSGICEFMRIEVNLNELVFQSLSLEFSIFSMKLSNLDVGVEKWLYWNSIVDVAAQHLLDSFTFRSKIARMNILLNKFFMCFIENTPAVCLNRKALALFFLFAFPDQSVFTFFFFSRLSFLDTQ